jgi:hypothetical protein
MLDDADLADDAAVHGERRHLQLYDLARPSCGNSREVAF